MYISVEGMRVAKYTGHIYRKANEQSEQFMRRSIWFILNIAIELIVFPTMIRSFYDYYFIGVPAETAFVLAFRIW